MSTSTLVRQETSLECLQSLNDASANHQHQARIMQLTKCLYQVDHQEKYLSLQAEVESLIQRLKSIKAQKLTDERQESPKS
ncbi:hypothetical protein [Merismopedia glauca]|uniref:Uncharacterized protein n=1 Tax=Merismopedia glauca CCAP 1448/3 TaxID=1296344 RepID=A0A2T1C903_9CYAN|nr:hypothetical protein [Merismopedia glauca]PSB04755.1 hypothetical protein C7B64_02750 [Merismopedia glauca CCAP 1448/3]